MKTLTYSAKHHFFDRARVKRAVGKHGAYVLGKFGAGVRRTARTMIEYRKKAVSKPGNPPRSHARGNSVASIRNILFAFNERTKSVIIGPVGLNMVQGHNSVHLTAGTVPRALEQGGTITVIEKRYRGAAGKWRRADMRRNPRPWEEFRHRTSKLAARPYMGPAFNREIKLLLPKLLKGPAR